MHETSREYLEEESMRVVLRIVSVMKGHKVSNEMRVGAVVGTRNKMNLMRKWLFFICLSIERHFCLAQTDPMGAVKDLEGIHFRDTIARMVFDSTTTRMYGWSSKDVSMVKYFKYIGDEPMIIVQAYTGDPHFICDFPREPLIKDHVYSFKICFSFHSRGGPFHKEMGFVLSNGERVPLVFKGEIIPSKE